MFFFRHTRAIEIGKSKIQLKTIIYNGWQLAPCPIHFPEMNLGNWQVQCIFSFISSINEEVDRSLLFCDLLISLPSCVLRLVSDTQFAYSYPPGSHGLQGLISPSWWCLKALFILWRPIRHVYVPTFYRSPRQALFWSTVRRPSCHCQCPSESLSQFTTECVIPWY